MEKRRNNPNYPKWTIGLYRTYMKRIITIQDISCIGKCSLTVALPIISALGIECSIVPTAVLSTHTLFKGFTFRDLTDDMEPIREHWIKEGFQFDAIYTGYLGSARQISIVQDYISSFGQNCPVIVDPAMADNGKLYTGFDDSFPLEMAKLCSNADIILPNISEAALMTGSRYPGEDATENDIIDLLNKLAKLGCKMAVITGVSHPDGTFGFYGLDTQSNKYFKYGTTKVNYSSHGTGDVFASSFTGALVNGIDTFNALKIAADYTSACIKNSFEDPGRVNYAVNFEYELPNLIQTVK